MTRTDATLAEIRRELEKRRHTIDTADDLRQVFVRVYFKPRSAAPKNTVVNYEFDADSVHDIVR